MKYNFLKEKREQYLHQINYIATKNKENTSSMHVKKYFEMIFGKQS